MKKQLNIYVDETVISKFDDLMKAYTPREAAVSTNRPIYFTSLIEREHKRLIAERLKNMPTLAEAEAVNRLPAVNEWVKGE